MDYNAIRVLVPDSTIYLDQLSKTQDLDTILGGLPDTDDYICKVYMLDNFIYEDFKEAGLFKSKGGVRANNLDRCKMFERTKTYQLMANTGCTPIVVSASHVAADVNFSQGVIDNSLAASYNMLKSLPELLKVLIDSEAGEVWNEHVRSLQNDCLYMENGLVTFNLTRFLRAWQPLVKEGFESVKSGWLGKSIFTAIIISLVFSAAYGDLSWATNKTKLIRSTVDQLSNLVNLNKTLRRGDINSSQFSEHRNKLNTSLAALADATDDEAELVYSPCYRVIIPPMTALTIQDLAYIRKKYNIREDAISYAGLDDLASLCYRQPGMNDEDFHSFVQDTTEGHSLVADLVDASLDNFNKWAWKVDPRVWAARVNQTLSVIPILVPNVRGLQDDVVLAVNTARNHAGEYDYIANGSTLTALRRNYEEKNAIVSGLTLTVIPGGSPYVKQ